MIIKPFVILRDEGSVTEQILYYGQNDKLFIGEIPSLLNDNTFLFLLTRYLFNYGNDIFIAVCGFGLLEGLVGHLCKRGV